MLQVKCKTLSSNSIAISNRYAITHGTAQGSCLGPLLFNIFCNDIYEHVNFCNLMLFADDTTLYASHQNLNYLNFIIQKDLENLNSWFKVNKLSLNIQKTAAMLFQPKQTTNNNTNLHLNIDNKPLPIETQIKFLGITIYNQLMWKEHISNLLRKISINKNLIGKSRNLMNISAKCKTYYAHIYPHLSYANMVWSGFITCKQMKQFEKNTKILYTSHSK